MTSLELTDLRTVEAERSRRTGGSSVGWRKTKLGLSIFSLLIGVALVVVGIALPFVVDKMIDDSVRSAILIDPQEMSQESLDKFYNNTGNEDFYLFNLTNLYDVLTKGDDPNFQEVGPIRTHRISQRYNVSWDTADSAVTYKWLTTFEVKDDAESQRLLKEPIIGPNVFFLGGAAQAMRGYIASKQNPMDPNWRATADFPGGFLSELVFTMGFMGATLLPSIMPQFSSVDETFLTTARTLGFSFYLQYVSAWCAQTVPGDTADCITNAQQRWYSAGTSGIQMNQTLWAGFELSQSIKSSNPAAVAAKIFDSTNQMGPASTAGLKMWNGYLKGVVPAAVLKPANSIDNDADVSTIAQWIGTLLRAKPDTTNGAAYQTTCCEALNSQMKRSVQTGSTKTPPTHFSQLYANYADFEVHSWEEMGALQFGTGLVVAAILNSSDAFSSGVGRSLAEMDPDNSQNYPFAFRKHAEAEPVEFTPALDYYIRHHSGLTTEQKSRPGVMEQLGLWSTNPSLLFLGGAGGPTKTLNLAQSKCLVHLLQTDSTALSGMVTSLTKVYLAYATVFPKDGITAANAAAQVQIDTAKSTTDNFFNKAEAAPLDLNIDNWYIYWSYTYNYLATRLTGYIVDIDPSSGVTPQNTGLFSKQSVEEMLFGFNVRFGNAPMPAIAGDLRDSANFQAQLDADYRAHAGRDWVQDTGHANIETIGQWKKYQGVDTYQYNCELVDPQHLTTCKDTAGDPLASKKNDWEIWNEPVMIRGSSPDSNSPPFKDGDDNIVREISLYVSEVKLPVSLLYRKDEEVKGITARRYTLNEALINASFIPKNTYKNDGKWKQSPLHSPDGLFDITPTQGGVPTLSSIPWWGHSDPTVYAHITCNGNPCSDAYEPSIHDTYLDVEPITGLTIKGNKRLQANFRVSAQEYWTGPAVGQGASYQAYPKKLPETGYINTTAPGGMTYHYNNLFKCSGSDVESCRETIYIPYYYGDIYDEITDDDAADARDSLDKMEMARQISHGFRVGGIIAGIVLIVLSTIAIGYYKNKGKKV